MTFHIAAPAAEGFHGGLLLGSVTMSGLALATGTALVLGVRGSDLIAINDKKRASWAGITSGTLFMAAGGYWADFANGVSTVPASILGPGSAFGDPGLGGIALTLTLMAFGPRWRRMVWPVLLGIASAVAWGRAGGVGGIAINAIRLVFAHLAGAS